MNHHEPAENTIPTTVVRWKTFVYLCWRLELDGLVFYARFGLSVDSFVWIKFVCFVSYSMGNIAMTQAKGNQGVNPRAPEC